MKQGLFNRETLIVKFGGPLSKPHNIFDAIAIKVPDYTYSKMEQECLGNGWKSVSKHKVIYTQDNAYIIIKDNVCIGYMIPYRCGKIKNYLIPIGIDTPKQIKNFIDKYYEAVKEL